MLVHAARAWALVNHQDSVTPQDVQDVFGAVVDHRLKFRHSAQIDPTQTVSNHLMSAVPIP